ncbi:MAG: hypothetical protein NWF10_02940, partial [Candidatus Bathyarchaeota archaeon]|nr:hypothetical protein [Candidatus Bathyarchaeota archaeon]
MEALIKIGGSLANAPKTLKRLCTNIGIIGKEHNLFIVPGGSKFADVVRDFDKNYILTKEATHRMSILAMNQYGFLLNDLIPNSQLFHKIKDYKKILKEKKIPVFLPAQYMFRKDPLDNSWNITSDSIAIYFAKLLQINNAIVVTDVDGIFNKDPKKFPKAILIENISPSKLLKLNQNTCVDKFLAKLILKSKINCF